MLMLIISLLNIFYEPGFVFDELNSASPFFHGRQLSNSIKVRWGESRMIEVERLLLAVAREDPVNQRFIMLSDWFVKLGQGLLCSSLQF
ncbi:hypothetical protein SLEP1_g56588 [Rubroshorea leprosula]|uniref:Uncharacterized protein n=1 Tax=Rubroshorea leprosula TaxID=152421 RepID=A0AAV5MK23_9ROSI|nr:hypothetical protein SLEP1_g56588 [Rubroshorea leprosula]